MGTLAELYDRCGQSPWLDNLKRDWLESGELATWVERGVRGITSNPSIFAKAIEGGAAYDAQFSALIASGATVEAAYWELVIDDIRGALGLLRPVYDATDGIDGYVSVEVAPALARDTAATAEAARHLHATIGEPNLYVKIPGTAEGLPAVRQMISEGHSVNVTLLFSVERYRDVMEAYLAGLEAAEGDLSRISSVASFFVSRVDTEVDKRLTAIGTPDALALKGKAAVANAQLAYAAYLETFTGPRWEALAARGARVQRPLWASTSTKDPSYPDTLYVDTLIGPHTVNTMPEATLAAFDEHGVLARTVDADLDGARGVLDDLAALGIDLADVTSVLEDEGVAAFATAFDDLLDSLARKAEALV